MRVTGVSSGVKVAGVKVALFIATQLFIQTAAAQIYSAGFEAGTPAGWSTPAGADAGWDVSPEVAHSGSYSLRSGAIDDNQQAQIEFTVNNPSFAQLDFWHFWNAENPDQLYVYVNGELAYQNSRALVRGWYPATSVVLQPGPNTVRFSYAKNAFGKRFCDCVRIDDVLVTSLDDDNDGMLDSWELDNGLNPADPLDAALDGDTDGLTNQQEFANNTDPAAFDSDGDGLSDGYEVLNSATSPLAADSDGDELPDGYEDGNGLNPNNAADADGDADADGASNRAEFRLGFDPQSAASVPPLTMNYAEGFESGAVPAPWFTPDSTDAGWQATTVTANSGSFSLQSRSIDDAETAGVVLPVMTNEATLSFSHYWNAKNGDELRVYANGVLVYETQPPTPRGWVNVAVDIPAGYNELLFAFEKDSLTGSVACNCVRIDDIRVTTRDADQDGMLDAWELDNGLSPADPGDAALDADSDGLTNRQEFDYGTNPNAADTDTDGADDIDEINTHGTNPLQADSDGDTMPDGFEVDNGLNPLDELDAWQDADGDLLQNLGEFRFGTDVNNPGSRPALTTALSEGFEGGALPAGWSVPDGADAGWTVVNSPARGNFSLQNDDVRDGERALIRFDVFTPAAEFDVYHYWNAITGDELRIYVNGVAVYETWGNDTPRGWYRSDRIPLAGGYNEIVFAFEKDAFESDVCDCARIDDLRIYSRDADLDGMTDEWETANGLNPTDPTDALLDADGEGLTNVDEFRNGSDPRNADTDGDGIDDNSEVVNFGTAPGLADTDGDYISDPFEIANGLNPLDAADGALDSDGDGIPNRGEFWLGSDPQNAASLPLPSDNFYEGFESGATPANWTQPTEGDPSAGWMPEAGDTYAGDYSLRTAAMPASGLPNTARIRFPVYLTQSRQLRWVWRGIDGPTRQNLYISRNGSLDYQGSVATWFDDTETLSAGYHELEFYVRRGIQDEDYCSCVIIDEVTISGSDDDFDGLDDWWELRNGADPGNAADRYSDADGDGLTLEQEFNLGTDPNETDSDGDGLDDGLEANTLLTDPASADSDADGMTDGDETALGFNPLDAADAWEDADGDRLQNLGELRLGYDPFDPLSVPPLDSGFSENFEGGVVPARFVTPSDSDLPWRITDVTAGDGVYSLQSGPVETTSQRTAIEVELFVEASTLDLRHFWNARNGDTLRVYVNGIARYSVARGPRGWVPASAIELDAGYNHIRFEFYRQTITEAACRCVRIDQIALTSRDVDKDWIPDAWELSNGLNPADPGDALLDRDSDGLNNYEEFARGTGLDTPDSDGDSLTDGDEVYLHFSDPLNPDTDGDGIDDGTEVSIGADPTEPDDADTDTDGDGVSNFGETRLGTDPYNADSTPPATLSLFESFESGAVPAAPVWVIPDDADAGWKVVSVTARSGTFSLQSESVGDLQTSATRLQVYTPDATELSFWRYWNASNGDVLQVYVNGSLVYGSVPNDTRGWVPVSGIVLPPGYNEVTFAFEKDVWDNSVACNCVRIDDVELTPLP